MRYAISLCVLAEGGRGENHAGGESGLSLARSGSKVLAIDFDVQNALRLHFGVPLHDGRGFVARSEEQADWSQSILTTGGNIFVLPYGDVTEPQRERFEENLMKDPHFIKRGLDTVLNYPVW